METAPGVLRHPCPQDSAFPGLSCPGWNQVSQLCQGWSWRGSAVSEVCRAGSAGRFLCALG